MCCRVTVKPLDSEIAETILRLGMFEEQPDKTFKRDIAEENSFVIARLEPDNNSLRLEISPSISHYDHHALKRITGGVYFEIAAKYAEKVGGTITQLSNVIGCADNGVTTKILAQYPEQPLMWEQVCLGFQQAILGSA